MQCPKDSLMHGAPDIVPLRIEPGQSLAELLDGLGGTCFEARNVARGAQLWKRMIHDGCSTWLGIAGAGIAGGLGGLVVQLIEKAFVDVICTTGAQAYHDLHFAFDLPVKAISPEADDDAMREHGDTRIYDIGIRERETLEAQDEIICRFMRRQADELSGRPLGSPDFMMALGKWAAAEAPHPERSFVVAAAEHGVPIFWDSMSNHSIGMNVARMDLEGLDIQLSPQRDVVLSAALAYTADELGFVELGGGGPKNFIQQTGPTISQILGIKEYEGASRGLQISTASVREGSLSGCTFGEAVTWGKYESVDELRLVQIWGEYSFIFPLLVAYVLERCEARKPRRLYARMEGDLNTLWKEARAKL